MTTPLSLLSLNEDILREILAHLLLDTPSTPNRASILQTCSLLHSLGLPFLYRVIDLRGFKTEWKLQRMWMRLFFRGGVLVAGRGRNELVYELRLGGSEDRGEHYFDHNGRRNWERLNLPNCFALTLCSNLPLSGSIQGYIRPIFSQVPSLLDLSLSSSSPFQPGRLASDRLPTDIASNLRALDENQQPRVQLRKIVLRGAVWFDLEKTDVSYRRLSLSRWSCSVLVVELRFDPPMFEVGSKPAFELFFEPDSRVDRKDFLKDTERIEFRVAGGRVAGELEGAFRTEVGARMAARELDAFERRIASLVVFVGEDGKERRLLDE